MPDIIIKKFPDPVLRKLSTEVEKIDDSIQTLIQDMFRVLKEEGGIGLAAPQIGISKRIIVVSLKERGFEKLALVNPIIEYYSSETESMEEGCLSLPGISAEVKRSGKVLVRGFTRSGREVEITAIDLLARVLQHEIDHLDGILFIDRLSRKQKKRIEDDIASLCMKNTSVSS